MNWRFIEVICFLFIWDHITVQSSRQDLSAADQHVTKQFDWLISDRGPFHHSRSYLSFVERFRQGFTTRYKIYREFARWKVRNTAIERRDLIRNPVPLMPDFQRSVRLLGRRPSTQQFIDTIIKKYGTHILISATLGGEEALTMYMAKNKLDRKLVNATQNVEALHQLASSYFIDRDGTMRKLHEIQISTNAIKVTETRTGPLGCSSYDNLDSVSSVLLQSPESKLHLQGLQVIFPEYLQEKFVQSALSYIMCNGEGEYICRNSQCICMCADEYPQCNCPITDIQIMENTLLGQAESWATSYKDFENSDEFKSFLKRLPSTHFLPVSSVHLLWGSDWDLQARYRLLQSSLETQRLKIQRTARKLFGLSIRCHHNPNHQMPRERSVMQWLNRVQSFLYCNENSFWGTFLESQRMCVCHTGITLCQRPIPCIIGGNNSCAMCSLANISQCGSCNKGYKLYRGRCEPQNVDSERSEQFISFETDLDFQDLELKYLLQKMDSRLYIHTTFISNEIRLETFFDPRWRKRMSLTLKSNKNRMDYLHMIIGLSMKICQMRNSSIDPMFFVYVNPFSGSHSEGWSMPFGEHGYPRWEKTRLGNSQCFNWTLLLGNRWKTFFETVHIYLRSRAKVPTGLRNDTGQGPVDLSDPNKRQIYIKISDIQVFGYSLRFNADLLRSAVQQVNQSYTQGTQFYSSSSVMLLLLDIRERINRLAPPVAPGKPQLDLFSCMLKHRLKLNNSEMIRVNHALDMYNTEILKQSDHLTTKLC
ncbi:BMP/retinoic acid-inducible neural-specific protein 1 isoform X1 [Oncorhynchus nerka]|uniref:BMP/retinoic acid-inducible neural-specific protein 1 n=3 Tax=Oncorhynchus TaxID=8016 RepID=A0A8C7IL22_ONCKI|nr:BMP/retinoic acid-inducible neural-specific protein 1 isoform X1 [Oncorhynchus kisutch]XP_021446616.2 BMP/retinoic acid-inducible neural-specific protein 1 [Oncorhynchus mykiss]XP_029476330.1 BMP/retinoic acid-inducible neural-specific protein 1 isoform X1 [Oncorhynchus nerka]XP_046172635.1 BMP/retinoic acid-inducible neural-specific protein 1 [Oncorhynchus gorbuscha]